jgi:hypothetical protein
MRLLRAAAVTVFTVVAITVCGSEPPAEPVQQSALPLLAAVAYGTTGVDLSGAEVEVHSADPVATQAIVPVTYADGALDTAVVLSDTGPVQVQRDRLHDPRTPEVLAKSIRVSTGAALRGDGTRERLDDEFDAWVGYDVWGAPVWAQIDKGDDHHWLLVGASDFDVLGRPRADLPEPDAGWFPGTGRIESSQTAVTPDERDVGGARRPALRRFVSVLYPLRPADGQPDPVVADGTVLLPDRDTFAPNRTYYHDASCTVPDGARAFVPGGVTALAGGRYPIDLAISDPASRATMAVLEVPEGGYAVIDWCKKLDTAPDGFKEGTR